MLYFHKNIHTKSFG